MKKITGIGVVLETIDGEFLFQERDEFAVMNPNRIAAFGGGIEIGESPQACAKRELLEELELVVLDEQLERIGEFESDTVEGVFIQMFIVRGIHHDELKLHEGRRVIKLPISEALAHSNVTNFTKVVLRSV